MADQDIVKKGVVGVIIIGIFILAFFLLKPIIIPIILGLLFAYILHPVYKQIKKWIPRKNLSAFILILGLTLLIVVPLIYLVPMLATQTFDAYLLFQGYDFSNFFGKFVESKAASMISINVESILGQTFSTFMRQFTSFLVNLPSFLLQFAVFIFTFFFAIRDADELTSYLSTLSPFPESTEKKFLKEFRGITNAIVFGQVLIGIVQGLAVGVGLFFLGVPKVLILTFIACVVSIIPILGSWLVWFPVGLVLVITGHTFQGVFLLLYGSLFVSTIDNFMRPYFLSKQSNLPIALSVIGTIGGLYLFGITGLLLGPLILAYVLIIIELYQQGKLNELFKK